MSNIRTYYDNFYHSIKVIFDSITVTGVFGYVSGWFTMPNLVTFFTLVWAFGRAFETIKGIPLHQWLKSLRRK
jgi:hypothetical protein